MAEARRGTVKIRRTAPRPVNFERENQKLRAQIEALRVSEEAHRKASILHRAITEELDRFKKALDQTQDVILMFDPATLQFSYANHGATECLGCTQDELMRMSLSEILADPIGPLLSPILHRDLERVHEEVMLRRKDGSHFPAEVVLQRVREPVEQFVAVIRDLTLRRKTEESLVLARQVFENSGEAIVITDRAGVIVDINPAFEEVTGYDRAETIGRKSNLTRSGRHTLAFYQAMWERILREGNWEGEIWDRRKNGEVFPKWLTINAIRDRRGEILNFVGLFKDISQQKATEERLERLAFFDPLTDLPNRALFRDRLGHELETAARRKKRVAVLFVDLDGFKDVNDTLGHDAGDALLVEAASRLTARIRKADTVSRLGGDEFMMLLPDLREPPEAARLCTEIIEVLQSPFRVKDREIFVGASIGVALFPDDGRDLETLTKCADIAMYQAKEAGGGTYRFFTADMSKLSASRIRALPRDRTALKSDSSRQLPSE